jgi:ELWxxDGT repeat protein
MKHFSTILILAFLMIANANYAQLPELVADLNPSTSSDPSFVIEYNNDVYFSADDGIVGKELRKYDGSTVTLVQDIRTGTGSGAYKESVVYNGELCFPCVTLTGGAEFCTYDGTNVTVVTVRPGAASSSADRFTQVGSDLYFTGVNTNGEEVWKFDGANVTEVTDLNPGAANSSPNELYAYNSELVFRANDGTNGTEFWAFDGTNVTLHSINPSTNSTPQKFIEYAGDVYFRANDGTVSDELWKYDGANVTLAADINPGPSTSSPNEFTIYNGELYFSAYTTTAGRELFKYDGTNVTLVADLYAGTLSSSPTLLTVYNNELYFQANTPATGLELFKYDGTSATLVQDIVVGTGSSSPRNLAVADGFLYFVATDNGVVGTELWRYDGTAASLVMDINPGSSSSDPEALTAIGSTLFFTADDGTHQRELWKLCTPTTSSISPTACGSYTSPSGNVWSVSGTYTDTIPNRAYCDSIITVNLTINSIDATTDIITTCDSLIWIDGNTYTSNNNTATHMLANVGGCDSLVTLDLTITNSNAGTDVIATCDSLVWIDGNTYSSNNNTATHMLTNVLGCDSLVTLNLTITNSTIATDVITTCDSMIWIDGNTYTSSNNTATHMLTNAVGCDSLVTLDLTITNSTAATDVIATCDSLIWIDGNTYTSNNNTATHMLTNVAGCDSLVTLDLTITNSTAATDIITTCDSLMWIDGNTYYVSNNTATHTLTNMAGCDSVVTLDLTINTADISVTNTSPTLTANAIGATYQWIDCSTMLPIAGEINQSFTATANGDYAVVVTENNCTDTSACFTIMGIGISENGLAIPVSIYPNPSRESFVVEFYNPDAKQAVMKLTDLAGRIITSKQTASMTVKEQFATEALATGMYLLTIKIGEKTGTYKVLKN